MLKLLLDEPISPGVAASMRRGDRKVVVFSMAEWEEGNFPGQEDAVCLQAAAVQRLTLVTYDCRTIPPLLKDWAEGGRQHLSVILVDEKTISPADTGGLVQSLSMPAAQARDWDWTGGVCLLQR